MGNSGTDAADDSAAVTVSDAAATTTTDTDVDVKDAVESPPPSSDSLSYIEGEKVLASHSQQFYWAKVQKVDFRMEWRYLVHYLGWSKNWDEWVGTDRLRKDTKENIQKHLAVSIKQGLEKNTKLGRSSQIKSKFHTVARGRKRKKYSSVKEKGTVPMENLVNIHIPSTLKQQLVDDCDFITHQDKLVKLPRTPTVDAILNKYLDYRLNKDGMIADSVGEILKGIRSYFDKALSMTLLYEKERMQYLDEAPCVPSSTIYGAEHLLRLFVKLPEILYHAHIEEKTLTELQQTLVDFLKFLKKNQRSFFLSTYEARLGSKQNDRAGTLTSLNPQLT